MSINRLDVLHFYLRFIEFSINIPISRSVIVKLCCSPDPFQLYLYGFLLYPNPIMPVLNKSIFIEEIKRFMKVLKVPSRYKYRAVIVFVYDSGVGYHYIGTDQPFSYSAAMKNNFWIVHTDSPFK